MNLILDYDQNQSSLPAGFVSALNYVVSYYDQIFTANVTVTIDVGYGEIDGQRLESGALGESEQIDVNPASYAAVRNALVAGNAAGASTLPSTPPAGSPGTLYMPSAEEKALGLIANNSNVDGYIGFASGRNTFGYGIGTAPPSNEYYFVGVAEHEISEIMGRTSYLDFTGAYSLMDLYRWSAPNTRQFTTGAASYFSIDSGATDLNNWNNFQTGNSGDLGDWAPSAGYDAYDDNSYPGVVNGISAADLINMAALGWTPSTTNSATPAPSPSASSQPAPDDFNGNGVSDLLLLKPDGTPVEWTTSGATIAASQSLIWQGSPFALPSGWSIAGIGDFNGDGTSDILPLKTDGTIYDWTMSGATIAASQPLTYQGSPFALPSGWSVAGVGDFNGDGMSDILLVHTDGVIYDWQMNGPTIAVSQSLTYQGSPFALPSGWSVAGIGDFNGDGMSDILLVHTDGAIYDWQMDGPTIAVSQSLTYQGSNVVLPNGWSVAGVGDFDGNGTSDILLVNTNGTLIDWEMSGSTVTAEQGLTFQGNAATLSAGMSVLGIGDYTGSGNADIMLLNPDGSLTEWQMNGATVTAEDSVTYQGGAATIPTGWSSEENPATQGPPTGGPITDVSNSQTNAAATAGSALTPQSGDAPSMSVGDLDNLQYVSPGESVTNPIITGGILQLASSAIVDGPIVFASGSTGTLIDDDQATLPDTVMGFNEGSTYLRFAGATVGSEAQVVASAQTVNGNTLLTFPDHTSIVLVGVGEVDTGIFSPALS